MSAPGRLSPCPCGSGKRYKDCHGALDAVAEPNSGDAAARGQLDGALAAQQAGRYAEAVALYEAVVAREPRNFDALHMLGVVHYQRADFDRAHALVAAALAIRPGDAGARHNMELIEAGLEHRVIERAICAEVLPRFAKRCVAAPEPGDRARWRGAGLDLIVSKSDMRDAWAEVDGFVDWLGAAVTIWRYRQSSPAAGASLALRTLDPHSGALPESRTAIFYGAEISPAAWYPQATAIDVALYCDAYDASALVDRIPELARDGRTPVHLIFASTAIARRTGLPGRVVDLPATP